MGTEAYLFGGEAKSLTFDELKEFLDKYGFVAVKNGQYTDAKNKFFELDTDKGITEIHILLQNNLVLGFYVRFALLNPKEVIEQTFQFFDDILGRFKLQIYTIEDQLLYTLENKKMIREKIMKKKEWAIAAYFVYDKPIRCDDVFKMFWKLRQQK